MSGNLFQRALESVIPEKRQVFYDYTTAVGLPYGTASSPLGQQLAMQLSAVYRCVDVISDAVASQEWKVLKHDRTEGFVKDEFNKLSIMLNNSPNKLMSRYTFMKTLVSKILLEGNVYVHIIRDGRGDAQQLNLITSPVTMFLRDNGTPYYRVEQGGYNDIYYQPGKPRPELIIDGDDMIHILNFTYDGITGISTLRHAANTMGIAQASELSAKGFFTSGANASGIINSDTKLDKEKAKAIKDAWAAAFDSSSGNPGGIAVMEGGLKFTPVTVNPKDAQMLETRKFNVIEICRFFGVSPQKVFDDANLTYSNVEAFQLAFITDTIGPLNKKIESEFNRKVFRPSQIGLIKVDLDLSDLLKTSLDTQANFLSKMFQCGGFSVNEVREAVGLPKSNEPNADKPFVQINMQPISDVGKSNKEKPKKEANDGK